MKTIHEPSRESGDSDAPSPLVLHIRRLRQSYGTRPITQAELEKLTDLSHRQIRRYETLRELPQSLERLLMVAMALEVQVGELLDPRLLEELRADVEARRIQLGLDHDGHDSGWSEL